MQRDQYRKDIKRSIQKKYKEIITGKKQRETTIAVAIVERAINIWEAIENLPLACATNVK